MTKHVLPCGRLDNPPLIWFVCTVEYVCEMSWRLVHVPDWQRRAAMRELPMMLTGIIETKERVEWSLR